MLLEVYLKEMAERICQNSPLSMRAIKELLQRGEDMSRVDAMSLTDHIIHNLNYSEDMQETVKAFSKKRPPAWKAR